MSRSALERVAREAPSSLEAMEGLLDLAPWRNSLVLEPLWGLLTGERVVRVRGYVEGSPRTTFDPVDA